MQSLRALAKSRRSLSSLRSVVAVSQRRRFSAHTTSSARDEDQVHVEGGATSRTVILHRPSSLNALTTTVGSRLIKLYESWEENPDIGFVVMKGSGRSFCAGGDVVALYRFLNDGKVEDCKDFFRTLYRFIYILGTYLKPHVAILDGITMGGGGGVSIPGTFRLATDKTIFATPETIIGFHPDAGASFYLSHLPGHLGEYLALTGEKLNGLEMMACGLATHYYPSEKLDWVDHRLGALATDDPSVIETSLEQYGDIVFPDKESVVRRMELVDRCFSHDTVEEIIDSLETEASKYGSNWCSSALRKLKDSSPLSLKVSLRSIREGRFESLDQCLIREYRMSVHGISKHISNDFCEGIRARLVEKDFAPMWDPPTLGHVSEDMVEEYFSPLGEADPELELPVKMREAFI